LVTNRCPLKLWLYISTSYLSLPSYLRFPNISFYNLSTKQTVDHWTSTSFMQSLQMTSEKPVGATIKQVSTAFPLHLFHASNVLILSSLGHLLLSTLFLFTTKYLLTHYSWFKYGRKYKNVKNVVFVLLGNNNILQKK
jgi:hypothetical protein